MNLENLASKNDMDEISRSLIGYAPMEKLKDLTEDVRDFVKKEDFNIVAREMDYLKKDLGKLCSKEEMMTRLNVFNSDVNTKMLDRPTIQYFKKVLQAYDQKIEQFNNVLNEQMEKLDTTQADQDKEIA